MGNFTRIVPVLIILALTMEYFSSSLVSGCFLTPRVHARVQNKLGEGNLLHLHCRSKDDDLGYKVLVNNQQFPWTFCINVGFTTLYYCDFWVQVGAAKAISNAKVFDAKRDLCPDCTILVEPDGVYIVDTEDPSHPGQPMLIAKWHYGMDDSIALGIHDIGSLF